LRDFLFKTGNEDVVNIDVFNLVHEFEFLAQSLTEDFGVRIALNFDDFDLRKLLFLFFELFQKFVLEIVDLDFL